MIKPIMVRTQARSGSTYLMQILSSLPDVVAAIQHPYEVRMAQYFAACYGTLSGTADHEDSSRPNFFNREKGEKWIGSNPFNNGAALSHNKWVKQKYIGNKPHLFLHSVNTCGDILWQVF